MGQTIIIDGGVTENVRDVIEEIKKKHGDEVKGIDKIYNDLIDKGQSDNNSLDAVHFAAYTLAVAEVKFTIK